MCLSERRFELRKWQTNHNNIRDFLRQNGASQQLKLVADCENRSICKVLRLNWNSQRDEFLF